MKELTESVQKAHTGLFIVSTPGPAAAAAKLDLNYSGKDLIPAYILSLRACASVFSWLTLWVSVLVGLFQVSPKGILSAPGALGFSSFVAAFIATALVLAICYGYSSLGSANATRSKDDDGLKAIDSSSLSNAVFAGTFALWLALGFIESQALSAYIRSSFHANSGQQAMSWVGGYLIAGVYVLGLAWAWYRTAYVPVAAQSVKDYRSHIYEKRKESNDAEDVALQTADRSLGVVMGDMNEVRVCEEDFEDSFRRFDSQISAQRTKLDTVPDEYLTEEKDQIARLERELKEARQQAIDARRRAKLL